MTQARKMRRPPPVPRIRVYIFDAQGSRARIENFACTLDRIIGRGPLKAKKHGHSTFVMATEVQRYIQNLPDIEPRANGQRAASF